MSCTRFPTAIAFCNAASCTEGKGFLRKSLGVAALVGYLFSVAPLFGAPGDLFVADAGNLSIVKITPNGTESTFASNVGQLFAIAFDRGGNIFVTDTPNNTIFKFTPAGEQGTFASDLNLPLGLAFDSFGDIFEADSGSGAIFKFTADGSRSSFASGLTHPVALAFDRFGNLFVSDNGSDAIYEFTPDGTRTTFSSDLHDPTGLAFDAAGNLFAVEGGTGSVLKFTPAGDKTVLASGFNRPGGIAFNASGELFVSELGRFAGNGMISKIAPDGTKTDFVSDLGAPNYIAFDPEREKLRNISTRGFVQTGDSVLIGGFIIGGSALINNAVVVRAIGPSLAAFNVPDPLIDPMLEIHDGTGAIIAANDDWEDTQGMQIEATGLAPNDPKEAAVLAVLPTGSYSAIVRGVGNTTGNALVEVYSIR